MNKTLKITINLLVFLLILGFGFYMIRSFTDKQKNNIEKAEKQDDTFVSPCKKIKVIETESEIYCFDIFKNSIYVANSDRITVFNEYGNFTRSFEIDENVRDMIVEENVIFLLYSDRIELYSLDGQKKDTYESCSNSDYCSFTTTKDFIFVTDVENKHICKYNKQGELLQFIKSPEGFIIPSYAFDIININDTIYCANSGRHKIESYTPDGKYITSFGEAGPHAGAFAGCCNPVYLEKTSDGHILTSEKGNPRISSYEKDGKFNAVLLDNNMLGGGTAAYEIHVNDDKIYIDTEKSISVYELKQRY